MAPRPRVTCTRGGIGWGLLLFQAGCATRIDHPGKVELTSVYLSGLVAPAEGIFGTGSLVPMVAEVAPLIGGLFFITGQAMVFGVAEVAQPSDGEGLGVVVVVSFDAIFGTAGFTGLRNQGSVPDGFLGQLPGMLFEGLPFLVSGGSLGLPALVFGVGAAFEVGVAFLASAAVGAEAIGVRSVLVEVVGVPGEDLPAVGADLHSGRVVKAWSSSHGSIA
jgi:hypothetical protein